MGFPRLTVKKYSILGCITDVLLRKLELYPSQVEREGFKLLREDNKLTNMSTRNDCIRGEIKRRIKIEKINSPEELINL